MKTVWTILGCLVMLAAQLLSAPATVHCSQAVVAACAMPCCHPGQMMRCCEAGPVAPTPTVPVNTTRIGALLDISLLAPTSLNTAVAVAELHLNFVPISLTLTPSIVPLHERLCVRLI